MSTTSDHPSSETWHPSANEVGVPAFVPGITLADTGPSPDGNRRLLAAIPYVLVYGNGICIPVEIRSVSTSSFDADTIGPRAFSDDAFRLRLSWFERDDTFTVIPVRGRSVANMKRDVSATLFATIPPDANHMQIEVSWPHIGIEQPAVYSVAITEIRDAQRRAYQLLGSEIDPQSGLTVATEWHEA